MNCSRANSDQYRFCPKVVRLKACSVIRATALGTFGVGFLRGEPLVVLNPSEFNTVCDFDSRLRARIITCGKNQQEQQ
jgi:hypothetical protein